MGLKTWNGSDPARRFAVYRNNVTSSLINALADTFPVVQELVGTEFFRAMAREYVRAAPPQSPLLALHGSGFPAFVESFAPAQCVPVLADMARLELARVQAYHAADAAPVARQELLQVMAQPHTLAALSLGLHPGVRVLRSRHAVASLWGAHQGLEDIAAVDLATPEDPLVLRCQLEVQVLLLPAGAAPFLQALQTNRPLGEAAAVAMAEHPDFELAQCLALLLRHDAITSLHHAKEIARCPPP
jgi:hypothetical protein